MKTFAVLNTGISSHAVHDLQSVTVDKQGSLYSKSLVKIATALHGASLRQNYANVIYGSHLDAATRNRLVDVSSRIDAVLGSLPASIAMNTASRFYKSWSMNDAAKRMSNPSALARAIILRMDGKEGIVVDIIVRTVANEGLIASLSQLNTMLKDKAINITWDDGIQKAYQSIDEQEALLLQAAEDVGVKTFIRAWNVRTKGLVGTIIKQMELDGVAKVSKLITNLCSMLVITNIFPKNVRHLVKLADRTVIMSRLGTMMDLSEVESKLEMLSNNTRVVEKDDLMAALVSDGDEFSHSWAIQNPDLKVSEHISSIFIDQSWHSIIDGFFVDIDNFADLDQKEFLSNLTKVGLDGRQIGRYVGHMLEFDSNYSSGDFYAISRRDVSLSIRSIEQLVKRYKTLLISLNGATEDVARLAVSEFLKSPEWNNDAAHLFMIFAKHGFDDTTHNYLSSINEITGLLGTNVVRWSTAAGSFDLIQKVRLDPDMRKVVSAEMHVLEDSKSDHKKAVSSEVSSFHDALADTSRPSSYDGGLRMDIRRIVDDLVLFLGSGAINSTSDVCKSVMNDVYDMSLVNSLFNPETSRRISRNQGLTLGSSYAISPDARKAVMDQLGMIDECILHSAQLLTSSFESYLNICVGKLLDRLSTYRHIAKFSSDLGKALRIHIHSDDTIVASIEEIMTALSHRFGIKSTTSDTKWNVIPVTGGKTAEVRTIISDYNRLAGHYDGSKMLKDVARHFSFELKRLDFLRLGNESDIKNGDNIFSVLWKWTASNLPEVVDSDAFKVSSMLRTSILHDNIKKNLLDSSIVRTSTSANLLTKLVHKAPTVHPALLSLGGMYWSMIKKLIEHSDSIERGNFADLASDIQSLNRLQVYSVDINPSDSIIDKKVLQSYSLSGFLSPLFAIVDDDLDADDFSSDFELISIKGSDRENLTYNILHRLGIDPYSRLNKFERLFLVTHIRSKESHHNYPLRLKEGYKDMLDADGDIAWMDLLTANHVASLDGTFFHTNALVVTFLYRKNRESLHNGKLIVVDSSRTVSVYYSDGGTVDSNSLGLGGSLYLEVVMDKLIGEPMSYEERYNMFTTLISELDRIK